MKGYKIRFVLTTLSICLCLTACGTATADDNSTAASVDIQSGISTEQSADVSAEQSADVSTEQSADVSVEASEEVSAEQSVDVSEEVSAEPMESTDISEDIDISEESAPTEELSEEPSEDESSVAPPAGTTEPEQDVSKPVEDTSKPTEDVSVPVEDTSKPTEDVSKVETPAPHTHSYSATTVSPTCTEQGYKVYTCSCGDSYKADYVKARGHMWKGWIVTKEATLEAGGEETRTCWICKGTETRATERLEPTKPIPTPVTPADAEWICNRIIELLNEERAKLGAPALSTAPIAHEMAMVRAQELTVVFSHNRPNGENGDTIFIDYNYNPERKYESWVWYKGEMVKYTGPDDGSENIALTGYYTEGSSNPVTTKEDLAVIIVEQFKASAGHWKDLTNPEYTGVGIGIVLEPSEYVSTIGGANTCIMTMDKTYG